MTGGMATQMCSSLQQVGSQVFQLLAAHSVKTRHSLPGSFKLTVSVKLLSYTLLVLALDEEPCPRKTGGVTSLVVTGSS